MMPQLFETKSSIRFANGYIMIIILKIGLIIQRVNLVGRLSMQMSNESFVFECYVSFIYKIFGINVLIIFSPEVIMFYKESNSNLHVLLNNIQFEMLCKT